MPQPHEHERPQSGRNRENGGRLGAAEPRAFDPDRLELPPLPYGYAALEPHISRGTLDFHHDKHHRAYVEKTAKLVAGTELEGRQLPEIIRAARDKDDRKLLNQAGQAWNHNIFWLSMKPHGGGAPEGRLLAILERDFGGLGGFREAFRKEAVGHFASGWAWLCLEGGKLKVTSFHDGDSPAGIEGVSPLLTCDVWEHAYYLDYQNRRPDYANAVIDKLLNWQFAADNLGA
jgi:Fe-Mn family superoxide dismutase